MPRDKDLKRLVRARMKKTGEAYTAARAQILRKAKPKKRATPRTASARSSSPAAASRAPATASARPSRPDRRDYATVAGMRDDAVEAKTGFTWARWVNALDEAGAAELSHGEIARLVKERYRTPDWWTQMVTVGYERITGRRARGQRLNGSYEATKSRTFKVPVATLFEAWADAGVRRRWLDDATVKVRTATAPKAMRLGWSDGTIVAVWFTAKGKETAIVAVAHTKLPDRATAERLKKYWSEKLDALGTVIGA